VNGDASDLEDLAEARLDDAVDEATWSVAVAAYGERVVEAALDAARTRRAAVTGLERPALPEALRARILTGTGHHTVAPEASPDAAHGDQEATEVDQEPIAFPGGRWRALIPALIAAGLLAAVLPILISQREPASPDTAGDAREQLARAEPAPEPEAPGDAAELAQTPRPSNGLSYDDRPARQQAGDRDQVAQDLVEERVADRLHHLSATRLRSCCSR